MSRPRLVGAVAALAALSAACKIDTSTACLDAFGPCGPNGGQVYAVAGRFAHTPSANGVTLSVGDTATLYYVTTWGNPQFSADTVRSVAWSVSNPSVATIASGPNGAGILVGAAPGRVAGLTANGNSQFTVWVCGAGCSPIESIDVIP